MRGLHIDRAVAFNTVEVISSGPRDVSFGNDCMSSKTLLGGQRRSSETACDKVVGGEGGKEAQSEPVSKEEKIRMFHLEIRFVAAQGLQ